MKQIGRELGVRYAVEGSVRKAGNRVRIAVQLIETETSAHVWADRYEGDLGDIFALQDELTSKSPLRWSGTFRRPRSSVRGSNQQLA